MASKPWQSGKMTSPWYNALYAREWIFFGGRGKRDIMAHCWLYPKQMCFYNHESQASLSSLWSHCMRECSLFENDTPILEHVIRYLFWMIHGLSKANDDFKRALIKNQLAIPEHVVNASDSSLGKNDPFNIIHVVDSHDKKDESLDTKKPWILHPLYSYIINSSSHGRTSRSSYPSFMISLYY